MRSTVRICFLWPGKCLKLLLGHFHGVPPRSPLGTLDCFCDLAMHFSSGFPRSVSYSLSVGIHVPSSWAKFDIASNGSQETLMCLLFPPTLVVPADSKEWPGPPSTYRTDLQGLFHPGARYTSVQILTLGHVTKPSIGFHEVLS